MIIYTLGANLDTVYLLSLSQHPVWLPWIEISSTTQILQTQMDADSHLSFIPPGPVHGFLHSQSGKMHLEEEKD